MSYDLMVFEPDSSFEQRDRFAAWYQAQTKWGEGHDYNSIEKTTPKLQAWLLDSMQQFPSTNSPSASIADESEFDTEYSIGSKLIYCCYAWPHADAAYQCAFSLAEKHRVGFYDTSSDTGQVWMPNTKGKLSLIHSSEPNQRQKFWTEAPPCPECGKKLRTKLAKQCFECGADWH